MLFYTLFWAFLDYKDALSNVHLHPSHDLNLGYRHAIWAEEWG